MSSHVVVPLNPSPEIFVKIATAWPLSPEQIKRLYRSIVTTAHEEAVNLLAVSVDVERDVQITFRPNTPYQTKVDFLTDLIRSAEAMRMNLFKNPPADYVPRSIDQDVFAKLPKPSMSADELMALTRGDDE